ncbi:PH domain-containing protein [Mesobacillus zeae]|uniref:YdbS-like PH domain-containing protein n=1 Tax=Mesobacillus zeae TaxID=1917180 RepID=A0A398B0Z3_9BACI|nr:PH domain-containing protein [Mesobacillus zeae]RID83589.1 hypothetical protein D1970_15570 [Mesobacillus zeae]
MNRAKRYHPLLLVFDLVNFVKSFFVFFIMLFVVGLGSSSNYFKYGRYVFILVFVLSFFSKIIGWLTHKYELDETSFRLYKGLFTKSELTVPFSKVQNVNRHTTLFHRIFKMTSLSFNTGSAGEDAEVKFEVISRAEADKMENYVERAGKPLPTGLDDDLPSVEKEEQETLPGRTVHFKPTKNDLLKASFTSLSFLFLVPLLFSFYFKIDDIFELEEEKLEGAFSYLLSSWWVLAMILVLIVAVSVAFGIGRTFLKYGKYELSSDEKRIYISKGMVEESAFSIPKEKVQAIEITQSSLKRLLGLAKVKLTSAGSISSGDDALEINTLYPFLPVERAYEMISEILPDYRVTEGMESLPKQSFWIRMLSPSWVWLAATAALYYFRSSIPFWDGAWWVLSVLLLITVYGMRLMDFFHTRYVLNERFVQFKKGSLTTTLFVSKRDKVIEVKVTRNVFQRFLGLASVGTVNRAKPIRHEGVDDVPVELADAFYNWYIGRTKEIHVE